MTLGWNVTGVIVLGVASIRARSVALAGFGLDSVIEIGASLVVLWELTGQAKDRQDRALKLIGAAFAVLAAYLSVQGLVVLAIGFHPHHSALGIVWTAATAVAMFTLAAAKSSTGATLQNRVLTMEGRVTMIDAVLAVSVLIALILNSLVGWWWADPLAGFVLVGYALREAWHTWRN